jgi:transposase
MANDRRFAMAAPVVLRGDYDAVTLRRLARSAGNPGQVRRLLALAAIYAGGSRSEAAAMGGVGLQTVRDWVLRFNAEGPAVLETGKASGNRPILGGGERAALRRVVEEGPTPAIHGAEAKGAALVLPRCTTVAMTLHLAEISQAVAPGAHAVVLLDQAGWHLSAKLSAPENITLLPLPAKSPELTRGVLGQGEFVYSAMNSFFGDRFRSEI